MYSKEGTIIEPEPEPDDPDHVAGIEGTSPKNVDVYNLQGMKLRSNVPAGQATAELPQGVYIVGQKKVFRH